MLESIKQLYTNEKIKLVDLEEEQTSYIKTHQKYLQKKKYVDEDLEKEVHEYICPNGAVGYQVFFYKKDGEDEYIKSIGYGQESKSRTFDWVLINKDNFI